MFFIIMFVPRRHVFRIVAYFIFPLMMMVRNGSRLLALLLLSLALLASSVSLRSHAETVAETENEAAAVVISQNENNNAQPDAFITIQSDSDAETEVEVAHEGESDAESEAESEADDNMINLELSSAEGQEMFTDADAEAELQDSDSLDSMNELALSGEEEELPKAEAEESQTAPVGELEQEGEIDPSFFSFTPSAEAESESEEDKALMEMETAHETDVDGADAASLHSNETLALTEVDAQRLSAPRPNYRKPVSYTVSFQVYVPGRRKGRWSNIVSRGANDGDRVGAFWVYPNDYRIHFRHRSTRTWNDGCDSRSQLKPNRWTRITASIKDGKHASIWIDGKLDNSCALTGRHHFTWGTKSNRLHRYGNDVRLRGWHWKNHAKAHLVAPRPRMRGPVKYTVDFELYVPKGRKGAWTNVWVRGESQSDRTPGVWIFPHDYRLHFRHASTRSWNDGCNSVRQIPHNRWVPIRLAIHRNRAWIIVDGKLDNLCDLGPRHHFTWGKRVNDIWHYSFHQTKVRKFRWRNASRRIPKGLPRPHFNRPVEYTVSYDTYITKKQAPWANLMNRGQSNADRTPGMWLYPRSTRIHFRHASTRTWNDGCDSSKSLPLRQWVNVKAVVKHNKAWLFINDRLDRLCELPRGHKFTWGKKSYGLAFGPGVHPGYAATKIRNFKWRNHARGVGKHHKHLPVPRPNFNRPVEYTLSVDVMYKSSRLGQWPNILLRGESNGDRTPGIWQWGSHGRIHFRHASTRSWNDGLNSNGRLRKNKWTNLRFVVKHRYMWLYMDGKLDAFLQLPGRHHFKWGKKNLGLAYGQAVHPSYPAMKVRHLRWSNRAEHLPLALPKPIFRRSPRYVMEFKAKIPRIHSFYQLIVKRGATSRDRTPGIWTVPNSSKLHVRHCSSRSWNDGLNTHIAAPVGRWFNFKLVMRKHSMTAYINGRKAGHLRLPGRSRWCWGKKSLTLGSGFTLNGQRDAPMVRGLRFHGHGRRSRSVRQRRMRVRPQIELWGRSRRPRGWRRRPRHAPVRHHVSRRHRRGLGMSRERTVRVRHSKPPKRIGSRLVKRSKGRGRRAPKLRVRRPHRPRAHVSRRRHPRRKPRTKWGRLIHQYKSYLKRINAVSKAMEREARRVERRVNRSLRRRH